MKLLTNIIGEYLKHNKRLVVPNLGTFIVKAQGGAILFSDLMRGDDGVLRSLLMAYGMKELEANGLIDRLVFEVRHATSRGESYTIEGLGDFTQGPNNTLTFRQKREKVVIGGNIKPPVETLVDEQRKIATASGGRECALSAQEAKGAKAREGTPREGRGGGRHYLDDQARLLSARFEVRPEEEQEARRGLYDSRDTAPRWSQYALLCLLPPSSWALPYGLYGNTSTRTTP